MMQTIDLKVIQLRFWMCFWTQSEVRGTETQLVQQPSEAKDRTEDTECMQVLTGYHP